MVNSVSGPAWFCIRTRPKSEHIAAAHLEREVAVEVFNPQMRIRRATKRGPVWFLEALFPGYLFARFEWDHKMMDVKGTPGVSSLVSFGGDVPVVPDPVVDTLRSQFKGREPYVVDDSVTDGENVVLAGGPFHGLEVKVLKVLEPHGRIQVLLEILGRTTQIEVQMSQVAREAGGGLGLEKTAFGKSVIPQSSVNSQK